MRNLALVWVLAGVAVALLAAGDGRKPPVSTFTDKRDRKVYKIVRIGSQVWFAENLNYDTIGSVCYDNKAENCAKYGRLYDWNTAMKACPVGTHLPTDKEWTTLVDYAGGDSTAGTKLKSSTGWRDNGNGTNDYGFSSLPSGFGDDGGFYGTDLNGNWWSATEGNGRDAWGRSMGYNYGNVGRGYDSETTLSSVRCVQDKEAQE